MTEGASLGVVLLIGLLGWLLADLIVWLKGGETFSKWVTKRKKEDILFRILALVIIIGGAALLIEHFDLLDF